MDNKIVDFSKFLRFKNVYKDGKIGSNRKENSFYRSFTGVTYDAKTKKVKVIVDARFYFPRETMYCCVWVRSEKNNFYVSGGGHAGGYGYDKLSAAFAEALFNAGFDTKHLSGVGENAMNKAITEIMEKLNYKNITVLENYG